MLTILSSNRGDVLEKVAEYLIYWHRYQDKEDVPDMEIPVHMCLELLVAADYLGIDSKSTVFSVPFFSNSSFLTPL